MNATLTSLAVYFTWPAIRKTNRHSNFEFR